MPPISFFTDIERLVEMGGLPIAAILCLSFIIFVLFFERLYFFCVTFKRTTRQLLVLQQKNRIECIWEQQRIHEAVLAEGVNALQRAFWLLKAAIVACPLIGLMGTVVGMIFVFDQISLTGTGNPRLMASGIFQATLPTMAGMLISIIGLIMQYILRRLSLRARSELSHTLSSEMAMEGAV